MSNFIRVLVLALMSTLPLAAQDPIEEHLFPPELVMQHQSALKLSSDQQEYIISEVQQAQSQFTGLQWKLRGEVEKLSELLQESGPDETRVLQQLEAMLDLERQIKRIHLTLAVRIKNTLSAEQQQELRRLRESQPSGPRRP